MAEAPLIPPFHESCEALMSLLASCPHEWSFWEIVEFRGADKIAVKAKIAIEAQQGQWHYLETSLPFSATNLYFSLKSENAVSKLSDWSEGSELQKTGASYQLKNSKGEYSSF